MIHLNNPAGQEIVSTRRSFGCIMGGTDMEQKTLSVWLKVILSGLGICGAVVYFVMIPVFGTDLVSQYPEFSGWYWPWQSFLWLTAVPCYAALVFGWLIAVNIGHDRSYSLENARLLRWISALAAGDSAFLFFGSLLYLLLDLSTPVATLISVLVVLLGAAVSVTAAALSHLIFKEATKNEE